MHNNQEGLRLTGDALTCILCLCSVEDVLKMESTCKELKRLVAERTVWLSQLQRLDFDRAPSLPPYVKVEVLSTTQIRDVVIYAVRGFRNWNRNNGPLATTRIEYPVKNFDYDSHPDDQSPVYLIPTVDKLLLLVWFNHRPNVGPHVPLKLFRVASNAEECIWQYDPNTVEERGYAWKLAYEVITDDVLVFVVLYANNENDTIFLDVLRVNTSNGETTIMEQALELPSIDVLDASITYLTICGDFIAIIADQLAVVVDWRRKRTTRLLSSFKNGSISIIDGILLIAGIGTSSVKVAAVGLSQLLDNVNRRGAMRSPVERRLDATLATIVSAPFPPAGHYTVSEHGSVITTCYGGNWRLDGLNRITVVLSIDVENDDHDREPVALRLCAYHFLLNTKPKVSSGRSKFSLTLDKDLGPLFVTDTEDWRSWFPKPLLARSGRMVSWEAAEYLDECDDPFAFSLPPTPGNGAERSIQSATLQVQQCSWAYFLEPYTGAFYYIAKDHIVIERYD